MARAALFLVLAVLLAACHVLTVVNSSSSSSSGIVTGGGINCGSTCTAQIASGTSVSLVAAAAAGSIFNGWFGCDTASGSACTLTMNGNRTVSALFGAPTTRTYALTVVKRGSGSGTVAQPGVGPSTPQGLGIDCGANCSARFPVGSYTLVATAASGSTFDGWSGCSTVSGNMCTVNVVGSQSPFGSPPSYTVDATFTATASNFTLSVAKTGTGSGTVSGNGINCGGICQTALAVGTQVTLTAMATSGSTFAMWTGCDSVSGGTCSLTLGTNRSVSAKFNQSATTSVTLFPSHANGLLSSTVDASKASTPYPNQVEIPIGCSWVYNSNMTGSYTDSVCSMGLMIFDVSSLSGHVITSATLDLPVVETDYVNAPGDPWDMLILSTAWNPNTVNWNTGVQGNNWYSPAPSGLPPGNGTVTFDLTATVTDWVTHPSHNNGFALAATMMSSPNATASDVFIVGGLGGQMNGKTIPPAKLVVQYQ
jgi:hypothetical protein